jgi:VWFA-related protein
MTQGEADGGRGRSYGCHRLMDNSSMRRAVPLLIAAWLLSAQTAKPPDAMAAAQNLDPQEAQLTAAPYFPMSAVTIQTETRLVEVEVVVRDSRGHPVSGLRKSDFEVRDEGQRRAISAFSVQSFVPAGAASAHAPAAGGAAPTPAPSAQPQPRWVGMVFDDISMPPDNLYNAKTAAKRFLRDGLAANDRVSVFAISGGLLLPFTADVVRISGAVDKVNLQERQVRSNACPLLTEDNAYQIANHLDQTALVVKSQEYANCSGVCGDYGAGGSPTRSAGIPGIPSVCAKAVNQVQMMSDALWAEVRLQSQNTLRTLGTIVDSMARMPGTRVILLASSGFLSGTLESDENQVVDKAVRANVVINSLDAKGLYTQELEMGQGATVQSVTYQQLQGSRPKAALNDAMANLADSTGGLYFHNSNSLDLGFKELGMQPEVSYLLGFPPEVLDSKYHHLKVGLTAARHATVQARKGYVAAPGKSEEQVPYTHGPKPPVERRIDREVFTTSLLEEAPVTVAMSPEKSAEGHTMARLTFHVDIGKVQFHDQAGARAQKFHMVAVLFDPQGTFVTGVEASLDLALKEATYQRVLPAGFNAKVSLEAPAGSYRLRTVAVEGDEAGRYSTATQPAEIH